MATAARYTGVACVILFGGLQISNDYTNLLVSRSMKIEDKTAGNETAESYNTTIGAAKADLTRFDTGVDQDAGLTAATLVGTTGLLEVRRKGTNAGLPVESFNAIVILQEITEINAKNTVMKLGWVRTGADVKAPGAVQ